MKIFILHKWRQIYVKLVLKELLRHNKPKDVIFLTDDKDLSKEYFWFDITYENISDYSNYANDFAKIYVHKSMWKYEYELICIQRWLIFLEYMEKHNIEYCWQVDSDVLVFCDLIDYANKYLKGYDFCAVASSWWTFYWSKKWLNEFKNFLFDTYKNKLDVLDWFYKKKWYPIYTRNNWYIDHEKTYTVSDMTLFYLFIYKEPVTWLEYKDIWMINNNTVFDDNIHRWVWFKHDKYLKSLKLINDNYYWTLEWKNDNILFNCLHFQWKSKDLLKYFEARDMWIKYRIAKLWLYYIWPVIFKISTKLWIVKFLMKVYRKIIKI